MNRRKNNLSATSTRNRILQNCLKVFFIKILPKKIDFAALNSRFEILAFYLRNLGGDFHQIFVMRTRNLRAIIPINFYAVVLWWIVASRNHDSSSRAELSHCKRQLWRRSRAIKYKNPNAISRQNFRRRPRKIPRRISHIVSDRHTQIKIFRIFRQIIRQSLRALSDSNPVQAVRASTDFSAPTSRAEFQHLKKTIFQLRPIFPQNQFQNLTPKFLIFFVFEPFF